MGRGELDFEDAGGFVVAARRQLDVQPILGDRPGQGCCTAQQFYSGDGSLQQRRRGAQRTDCGVGVRPGQEECIEGIGFAGKADVSRGEGSPLGIGEGTCGHFGRAFTVDFPRACGIDGLAIDGQPAADGAQNGLFGFWDSAVGAWADVEQQRAIFAHHIDQILDQGLGAFVFLFLDIAPGVVGDRGIVLPEQRANVAELAPFDVQYSSPFGIGGVLIIDGNSFSPFLATVVVIGCETLQMLGEGSVADPPVEPDELGLIEVDQFAGARQLVVQKFLAWVGL